MIDASTAAWPDVKAAWDGGKIAVLPFGAQEEHGPHCALSTDTVMAAGLAARLAAALDAVLLPAVAYGETWSTSGWAGTVTLSADTVRRIAVDIGSSLASQGAQSLVIVNGHFGNHAPLELACRALHDARSIPTLLVDYPGLAEVASRVCTSDPAAPTFYHADEVETSVMLALAPGHVSMDRAQAEYPRFPATFGSEPILLSEFCTSGVFGDPRAATKAKGERILEELTARALELVRAFLARYTENGRD